MKVRSLPDLVRMMEKVNARYRRIDGSVASPGAETRRPLPRACLTSCAGPESARTGISGKPARWRYG
jgi:hypothetical protein